MCCKVATAKGTPAPTTANWWRLRGTTEELREFAEIPDPSEVVGAANRHGHAKHRRRHAPAPPRAPENRARISRGARTVRGAASICARRPAAAVPADGSHAARGRAAAGAAADGSAPSASALAARCDERIEWAARQGVAEYPELYGLNSSSPRAAFQLHLHLYVPSSGCTDPRAAAARQPRRRRQFCRRPRRVLCAVCNACALGYLRPPRVVRAALRALGCLAAPTRPSYLGSTWAREEASLRGAVAAAHSGGAAGADAGVKSEPGAGASLLSSP